MCKENLFQLIRNEEVIIWAGSGFSLYAGYPSGTQLREIIFNKLSESERANIQPSSNLQELAEDFYRIKGHNKNALTRILIKLFRDFIPTSTIYHDKLASIPHFKTIITTNYDNLFENSYKLKGQVAFDPKHVPYLEKGKTDIFKVHGDLSLPESIIITKSDYNRFFKDEKENDVFWTVIKERLLTKNVLFIGYNLEDPNISVIFERITDSLGTHRKECFFIAPDLSQTKINDLVYKGIQYINLSVEKFIDELLKNLHEFIIDDLENGLTSADTFKDFLHNKRLNPTINVIDNSFKLKSIDGIDGKTEALLRMTFPNDKSLIEKFQNFIRGNDIGEFELSAENTKNLELRIGGLKIPNINGESKLLMTSLPTVSSKIDIRFENGFEINDLNTKLFVRQSFIEIHIEFISAFLSFRIYKEANNAFNITLNYKHNELCSKIKNEIELFSFLNFLSSSVLFTVYLSDKEIAKHAFPSMLPLKEESEKFLTYFNLLNVIEQSYKIKFPLIRLDSVTDDSYDFASFVVLKIKGENKIIDWEEELQFELNDMTEQYLELLKSVNEIHSPVVTTSQSEEIFELHSHKINIGYKRLEIIDCNVVNLESILNKSEKIVRIKSMSKKMQISYINEL